MNIGDKLKLVRQSKKITQLELAKLLNKSVSTIQKYESNKVLPSINTLQEISKKLNININELINYDNYQQLKTNKADFLQTISMDLNTFDKLSINSQEAIFMEYSTVPFQFLKLNKFLNKLNDEELKEEYMALHKEITNFYINTSKEYVEKHTDLLKTTIKQLEAQQTAKIKEATKEVIKIKSAFEDLVHAIRSTIDYNNSLIITITEYINDETIIIKDKDIKDKLIEFITRSLNSNAAIISDLDKTIEMLNGNKEE